MDKKEPTAPSLEGSWLLRGISVIKSTSLQPDAERFMAQQKLTERVQTGMLFSLFSDHTFTQVDGDEKYTAGKWKAPLDNSKIILQQPGGKFIKYSVSFKQDVDVSSMKLSDSLHNEELIFTWDAPCLKIIKNDPFYGDNNTWRLRDNKPGTDIEIKHKLANYIKHYAAILQAASELKKNQVSFEFSKGIITIYNGGIGIVPFDDVTPDWVHCFYSESDARKAHTIFGDLLSHTQFKGTSTGNWIEDDYNILVLLYGNISKK